MFPVHKENNKWVPYLKKITKEVLYVLNLNWSTLNLWPE